MADRRAAGVRRHMTNQVLAPSRRTITSRIAGFLRASPGGVPETAMHEAKRVLLNGLRASLAAVAEPLPSALVRSEEIRLGDRQGQSTVLWRRQRLPAEEAASCNVIGWSFLLLDDTEPVSGAHPGGPAACASMAVGDEIDAPGMVVLEAIARSLAVQTAFASAVPAGGLRDRGFAPLTVMAPIGSMAAVVALTEMTLDAARSAAGLAAMSGVGVWEMGGTTGAAHVLASAVKLGMAAVRAAVSGAEAPPLAIEGESGFYRAYCGTVPSDAPDVFDHLQDAWVAGDDLWYPPYSGDTYSQAPLEALADLQAAHPDLAGRADVSDITVGVAKRVADGIGLKHSRFPAIETPSQLNSDPQARVATAWLYRDFSYGPGWAALAVDPGVADLRERVSFVADPRITDMNRAWVKVRTLDGGEVVVEKEAFRGSTGRAVSDDELSAWFSEEADRILSRRRRERILDRLWHLDQLESVRDLTSELGGVDESV